MLKWVFIGLAAMLIYRWVVHTVVPQLTGKPPGGKRVNGKPDAASSWSLSEDEPERSHHEVLGVEEDASPEEIKAAYQRLIKEYHPDRVSGSGAELVELAQRRTREIIRAYDALRPS